MYSNDNVPVNSRNEHFKDNEIHYGIASSMYFKQNYLEEYFKAVYDSSEEFDVCFVNLDNYQNFVNEKNDRFNEFLEKLGVKKEIQKIKIIAL